MGAPPKEVVLLVVSPLRSTSTEAVRKITSCYVGLVMFSEGMLHVSALARPLDSR